MIRSSAFTLTLILAVCPALTAQEHAPEFRPEAMRAHVAFLANDVLEGRGTGTRGHRVAAEYVAAQFEMLGLKTGNGDSYLQEVPFLRAVPEPEKCSVDLQRVGADAITLKFGDDFVSRGSLVREDALSEGALVYVGYGTTAPAQKYDDYSGTDVHGKIVVILGGAPRQFPNDLRAHYSAGTTKAENAARHGAIGIIQVSTTEDEGRYSWDRIVRGSKLGSMTWTEANGTAHGTPPEIVTTVSMSHNAARTLFAGAPVPIDDVFKAAVEGHARPMDLVGRASVHLVSTYSHVESPNVVGVLPGSDPKLASEYLVYSAHLDHLGISEPVDGDSINNGALDNASGVAAILEIAHAFVAQHSAPKRSIIFLAVTGEEKGLRGADYFANNPTVPVESLVADINIDEILMFHRTKDMVPIGAEHSSLGAVVKHVAKKLDVELSPDPFPEEVVFVRSDQYPFVRRGVPAIFLNEGYKALDGKSDILAEDKAWVKNIYHTPKDDMSQKLDFRVGADVARFAYYVGLEVANDTARPTWTAGDFFAAKAE